MKRLRSEGEGPVCFFSPGCNRPEMMRGRYLYVVFAEMPAPGLTFGAGFYLVTPIGLEQYFHLNDAISFNSDPCQHHPTPSTHSSSARVITSRLESSVGATDTNVFFYRSSLHFRLLRRYL